MSRARDNADGARLDAPLASPAFTGTVAIPNVANLETAVVANTAKVTNHNQTLAEINALDVTELGTVTSGNLANTAIVYPVGHVIQTVEYVGTGAYHTHSLNEWVTVVGGTFTPSITITAGNKIAIHGSYFCVAYNGGVDTGCNLRIIDTTNSNAIINASGDSTYFYISVTGVSGCEWDGPISINKLYTPASGTTINFDTQTRANWGGTVQMVVNRSSVILQEIQA